MNKAKLNKLDKALRVLDDADMKRIDELRGSFILCFDKPVMDYEVLTEKRKAEVVKQHGDLKKYAKSKGWKDFRILRVNKLHMDMLVFMQAAMQNIIGDDYDY